MSVINKIKRGLSRLSKSVTPRYTTTGLYKQCPRQTRPALRFGRRAPQRTEHGEVPGTDKRL